MEYYKLEPWGDDWERASIIAASVVNAMQSLAAGFSGQQEEIKPLPFDAFVPFREHPDEETEQLEDTVAQLERLRGV